MKKSVWLLVGILITSIISVVLVSMGNSSIYQRMKSEILAADKGLDIKDKEIKYTDIDYEKNDFKDKKLLKIQKVEDINGYVSDADLSKDGGKYIRKSLMTYQEYIDLGISKGIRHDISPDRLVWVLMCKYDKSKNFDGRVIEKPIITTVYDAETGASLQLSVDTGK